MKKLFLPALVLGALVALPGTAEAGGRHGHGHGHRHGHRHGHGHHHHQARNPNRCHWHPNKGVGHCHRRGVHGPRPRWTPFVVPYYTGFNVHLDF